MAKLNFPIGEEPICPSKPKYQLHSASSSFPSYFVSMCFSIFVVTEMSHQHFAYRWIKVTEKGTLEVLCFQGIEGGFIKASKNKLASSINSCFVLRFQYLHYGCGQRYVPHSNIAAPSDKA
jgi:hypothetical protein